MHFRNFYNSCKYWSTVRIPDSSQIITSTSSHRRCSVKKGVLRNFANSQENTCVKVAFLIKLACNLIKKENLAQVFSCEFCEVFKNTLFIEHLRVTASEQGQYGAGNSNCESFDILLYLKILIKNLCRVMRRRKQGIVIYM